MGLFFVSKKEYQLAIEEQDRLRDLFLETRDARFAAEAELRRLTRAIKVARKSLDKAVPVEVVHAWKAK